MAIKLFGNTIQTPPASEALARRREAGGEDDEKVASNKEDGHQSIDPKLSDEEMSGEPNFSEANEEKNNPDIQKANCSTDKSLIRKPDVILPCPRCESLDTKFCYFNNYKVKQPRHFCKHCQRYWTAGGSIRNVPIGAGRRKSKTFAVNRQIRARDCALDVLRESIRHSSPLKPNGTLLSFGSVAPRCQSMASSVLDLVEKKMVMKISANETNKATNSNCYGLHPCLSGSNLPNPCSQIPPQSTPVPFIVIRACWGTPDYYCQHH